MQRTKCEGAICEGCNMIRWNMIGTCSILGTTVLLLYVGSMFTAC